jgi:hypothetical protein
MGMSKEEVREALELATRIVQVRQVLGIDRNGVQIFSAQQQGWF